MKKRVLVIAAHPDDELLGCGGTIIKHANNGDIVEAIIACEGESVRYTDRSDIDQNRYSENAAKIAGISKLHRLGFSDQQLDIEATLTIAKRLETIIDALQPNIIYCQFGGDVNQDHQALFQAANIATRPTRAFIEVVYAFDTASSTEWGYPRQFIPDTWVDISQYLKQKLDALSCYESEMREFPHPRSLKAIEAKAIAWGVQVCSPASEVFMTVRKVVRGS